MNLKLRLGCCQSQRKMSWLRGQAKYVSTTESKSQISLISCKSIQIKEFPSKIPRRRRSIMTMPQTPRSTWISYLRPSFRNCTRSRSKVQNSVYQSMADCSSEMKWAWARQFRQLRSLTSTSMTGPCSLSRLLLSNFNGRMRFSNGCPHCARKISSYSGRDQSNSIPKQ